MSWTPQWPAPSVQQSQVLPSINPTPSVLPPGLPYSPDQWAQMQQQNWQQWAQWQQQYQQWHQQYGAEYQKSMNALAAQQTTAMPNVALPPPLPTESQPQPPLPKEDGPKPAPPLPNSVNTPLQQPTLSQYTSQPPPNNFSTPPSNFSVPPTGNFSVPPNNFPTTSNNFSAPPNNFSAPPPNFNSQTPQTDWRTRGNEQKRTLNQTNQISPKRQMVNRQGPSNQNVYHQNPEELSEAEKKFDKQFEEWESQFNKWKDQNSGHPDKQQYREYEKKWEQWRQQLLDRREAMRKKRLAVTKNQQQFNVPPPPPNKNQYTTFTPQKPPPLIPESSKEPLLPTPKFDKPPPDMNNEPLQFKKAEKENEETGLGFLNASKIDGIPGLDLVTEEDENLENSENEVSHKGPDLEAISKGINNILGDQKLMSMLSMVSQNQNLNQSSRMNDVFSNQDLSNLSGENSQNEPLIRSETVQNFDDQTRSSFTQPNEHDLHRMPINENRAGFQGHFDKDSRRQFNDNFEDRRFNDFSKPPPSHVGNFGRINVNEGYHSNRNTHLINDYGEPQQKRSRLDSFDGVNVNRRNYLDSENVNSRGGGGSIGSRDEREEFGLGNMNDNQYGFGYNKGLDISPREKNNQFNRSNRNNFGNDQYDNRYGRFENDNFMEDEPFNNRNNQNMMWNDMENERIDDFGQSGNSFRSNNNKRDNFENRFNKNQPNNYQQRRDGDRSEFKNGMEQNFRENIDENRSNLNDNFDRNDNYPPPLMSLKINTTHRQIDMEKTNHLENNLITKKPDQAQLMKNTFDEDDNIPLKHPQENENNRNDCTLDKIQADENIWKPEKVIDYDHKSLNKQELDILVEPFRMFDYRHKPLRRIPFPDRPNWLSDTVRMIPEFDPPIFRTNYIERRFDHTRERFETPEDRYNKYERKNYEMRFSPPPPSSVHEREDKMRSRRNKSRSPLKLDEEFNNRSRERNWEFPTEKQKNRNEGHDSWNKSRHWKESEDLDIMDFRNNKYHKIGKDENRPLFPLSKPEDKKSNVTLIEDIINPPGRFNRPSRIVIILRGPPGSGKTHLAKLIKDKEVENGGSAPRILSLDDYFMVEQEKDVVEDGKKIKMKEMVYEFEANMEESYRVSLMKSFKKTITDGYFPFIIVDNVNDKVKYFGEMWSFAKQNGFQVYICQLDLDVQNCTKRNVHNRTEQDIRKCVEGWENTPSHHPVVDAASLIQGEPISEVEMEEINSPCSFTNELDEDEEVEGCGFEDRLGRSKWDNFDCSINNLARLDGLSKPLKPSTTMEEYLQLEDECETDKPTKPGQKRVRWADLEERKQQQKMRAIGFVVGQTDWDRMMDPTMGESALTQTKYIEKIERRRF